MVDLVRASNPRQLGQLIHQSSVPVGGHVKPAAQPEARRFVVVHSQSSTIGTRSADQHGPSRAIPMGSESDLRERQRYRHDPDGRDGLIWPHERSVFFVTLIPCALSHALCSACALVKAAVLGRLLCLGLGMDILITRDIRSAPAGCADKLKRFPGWMSCWPKFGPR